MLFSCLEFNGGFLFPPVKRTSLSVMSNQNECSGWEFLKLVSYAERRATVGTIKTSSERAKPDREKRPYGGRCMSRTRLFATRPEKDVVAQRTRDITM